MKKLLALALMLPSVALAAPFAYVSNEGSGTVSVIDTSTDAVVDTLQTGGKPRGAAIGADGRWLYVSDQPNNRLVLIDLKERKQAGAIALGVSPEGVGRSPDGRWIAAASEQTNSVAFIDTATQREVFTVKLQGQNPEHAVFSPDGKFVYASAEDGDTVEVIDVDQRAQTAQIKVGPRPRGIGFLPDGSRAYVAAENADTVFVIDAKAPTGANSTSPTAAPTRFRSSTRRPRRSSTTSRSARSPGAWWCAESDFPARHHVSPQGFDFFGLEQVAPGRHLILAARHGIDEALALAAREFPQVGGALRVEHARSMAWRAVARVDFRPGPHLRRRGVPRLRALGRSRSAGQRGDD